MWDSKTFLRTYLNFILILPNKFYFKTRIWLQDKAQADKKAEHTNGCEHFEAACNAVLKSNTPF